MKKGCRCVGDCTSVVDAVEVGHCYWERRTGPENRGDTGGWGAITCGETGCLVT